MKTIFTFFLLFSAFCASAQLSFPKGFHAVKGETLSGEDDVYTNERYSFLNHKPFRAYDNYKGNDDKFTKYVSEAFGFPFYKTRDSLLWGTGKTKGGYSYIIVTSDGEAIELFSTENDKGFATYSKWLLNTIRDYRKKGKPIMFPMRAQ